MTARKAKWDEQKILINQNTIEAYNKLVSDLKDALKAHTDYWTGLADGWKKYYKDLLDLQTLYQGVNGVPPLPGSTPPPEPPPTHPCPPGTKSPAAYNTCLPYE